MDADKWTLRRWHPHHFNATMDPVKLTLDQWLMEKTNGHWIIDTSRLALQNQHKYDVSCIIDTSSIDPAKSAIRRSIPQKWYWLDELSNFETKPMGPKKSTLTRWVLQHWHRANILCKFTRQVNGSYKNDTPAMDPAISILKRWALQNRHSNDESCKLDPESMGLA